MDKYNRIRKINRVTFHMFLIAFIVLIPALIARDITFIIILSSVFVVCLIIYIITKIKLDKFLDGYKEKCPICGNSLNIEEEIRYYINGVITDKFNFETSIEKDKKIEQIYLYKCENDNYEYYEIETYFIRKNSKKLLSKKRGIKG